MSPAAKALAAILTGDSMPTISIEEALGYLESDPTAELVTRPGADGCEDLQLVIGGARVNVKMTNDVPKE